MLACLDSGLVGWRSGCFGKAWAITDICGFGFGSGFGEGMGWHGMAWGIRSNHALAYRISLVITASCYETETWPDFPQPISPQSEMITNTRSAPPKTHTNFPPSPLPDFIAHSNEHHCHRILHLQITPLTQNAHVSIYPSTLMCLTVLFPLAL